ncbi:MAG: SnoaL-like polyketide cyclase [Lysobacterales bacterium 63-13]|nr:MAG: SnoaL-like polyketide cyclase [Xanthomonadales bacterium 63-13]
MDRTEKRSAREVLDDHLKESQTGSVEADLARNYAEDVVVLMRGEAHHGHEGVRGLARLLRQELPDASFEYGSCVVASEFGFLEWSGRGGQAYVKDGADSYVIREGKIVAQTIHYTVQRSSAS